MNDFTTAIDQVLINPYENDLFSVAFFALALLLAMVWRNFLIVFVHKTREMLFSHDWRSFEAENANSGPRLRIALTIITLSSVSIFLYQFIKISGGPDISLWLIALALFGIHFFRMVVTKFIEFVFKLRGMYEIWVESYSWIHYIIGVLFFPLAVLMTYSPEMSYAICGNLALAFFILGEFLLFYRFIVVFYNGIASLFYLFLYLCTLEILPLLTVFRFFT